MKNDLCFQKGHKLFGEFSHKYLKVMLDNSSVYNALAEAMYFSDKCIFWARVVHQILTFWTFHCLLRVVQIPHMSFETRS